MGLTAKHYFSPASNMKYCSASQIKAFMRCPAAALAELKGEWQREETTALLVGSYIDSYFEGKLDEFKAEHPEIFKRDGSLKAEYIKAEEIIERVSRDELFMKYMSGRKQVVKTGCVEGVPVKIKIDSYHKGKAIVDLKIIKDFEPIWNEEKGCREDFITYWGYDIQGALYQAVEGNSLPFYLAAATKETETDFDVIEVPQPWLDDAMLKIRNEIGIIDAYKRGELEAPRCGKCKYCRQTKKLRRVRSADEFIV